MTLMIEHISVKAQAREGLGYRYDRSLLVTPALLNKALPVAYVPIRNGAAGITMSTDHLPSGSP